MRLIASGAIALAFIAIGVAANAYGPAMLTGAGTERFMAALIVAAILSIGISARNEDRSVGREGVEPSFSA